MARTVTIKIPVWYIVNYDSFIQKYKIKQIDKKLDIEPIKYNKVFYYMPKSYRSYYAHSSENFTCIEIPGLNEFLSNNKRKFSFKIAGIPERIKAHA